MVAVTFFQRIKPTDRYFLLELNSRETRLQVTGFRMDKLMKAQEKYAEAEKALTKTPGADSVLVSVHSLNALECAYPTYSRSRPSRLRLAKLSRLPLSFHDPFEGPVCLFLGFNSADLPSRRTRR